jgi:hypothetical protein
MKRGEINERRLIVDIIYKRNTDLSQMVELEFFREKCISFNNKVLRQNLNKQNKV